MSNEAAHDAEIHAHFESLSPQRHERMYAAYYSALLSNEPASETAQQNRAVLTAILAFGKISEARKKMVEKETQQSLAKNTQFIQEAVWAEKLKFPLKLRY